MKLYFELTSPTDRLKIYLFGNISSAICIYVYYIHNNVGMGFSDFEFFSAEFSIL